MATETLTTSNLYNNFAVFREILKSISAFTALNSKFTKDERYFEDEPNTKGRNWVGYPFIVISTEVDDEHITYKGLKQINYSTTVTIYVEYAVETNTGGVNANLLNSYMNAIVDYLNTNQTSLLRDYGIDGLRISRSRDRDELNEQQLVLGILTCEYNVKLDVEN